MLANLTNEQILEQSTDLSDVDLSLQGDSFNHFFKYKKAFSHDETGACSYITTDIEETNPFSLYSTFQ